MLPFTVALQDLRQTEVGQGTIQQVISSLRALKGKVGQCSWRWVPPSSQVCRSPLVVISICILTTVCFLLTGSQLTFEGYLRGSLNIQTEQWFALPRFFSFVWSHLMTEGIHRASPQVSKTVVTWPSVHCSDK